MGGLILKWMLREMGCRSLDLIHVVQDMGYGGFL
jgi:hypothetical protein